MFLHFSWQISRSVLPGTSYSDAVIVSSGEFGQNVGYLSQESLLSGCSFSFLHIVI